MASLTERDYDGLRGRIEGTVALLTESSTGRNIALQPEHLIGRAPICPLRLEPLFISGQHALLRWTGARWELKDLNSRNGTFLNGNRIDPFQVCAVEKGARIGFGKVEEAWELADDSAPRPMAIPIGEGPPVLMDGDLLALPSTEDPRVTIYRDIAGSWVIEQPNESTAPIKNADIFESVGRWWRFCCTEDVLTTALVFSPTEIALTQVELVFAVSSDEEYVELRMMHAGRPIDMGARARNYLLLTLARCRLEDARANVPEAACGWISPEDCPHDPAMAPLQLNLDVFRIRKQFATAGVLDAASIIERRPQTRQLRIGTARISVVPL